MCKYNDWARLQNIDFFMTRADTRAVDSLGNTPLYYAVVNNNFNMTLFLLKKEADPNAQCEGGNTPMHMAFQTNNPHVSCFISWIRC